MSLSISAYFSLRIPINFSRYVFKLFIKIKFINQYIKIFIATKFLLLLANFQLSKLHLLFQLDLNFMNKNFLFAIAKDKPTVIVA
jgi:hypothetical protein